MSIPDMAYQIEGRAAPQEEAWVSIDVRGYYWWSNCSYIANNLPRTCMRSREHMWLPYNYRVIQ